MSDNYLDWTVSEVPAETESAPAPLPSPGGPASRSARSARAWLKRYGWLLVLLPLLVAGSAWAFTRLGWRRLEAQITREIQYEDERALGREVELVQALQAEDHAAWLELRAAESALGLPAPLPAAHLLPAAQPPELLELETNGNGVFTARVLRYYEDAAGQVYGFELVQRYHNLGPGLWERLPPDEAALSATTLWQGRRLAALVPLADQALLAELLPEVDALLRRACEDWDCSPDHFVPLAFTGQVAQVTAQLSLPARTWSGEVGPYPLVYDLPVIPGAADGPNLLPAPSLIGLPHDAAAKQQLLRYLAVRSLVHLAERLSNSSRQPLDFYFDALVAREEIRLGLSQPSDYLPPPAAYLPPNGLWDHVNRQVAGDVLSAPEPFSGAVDRGLVLHYHLQAQAFLDFALEGRPLAIDGGLLRILRGYAGVTDWLVSVYGRAAHDLSAQWTARINQTLGPAAAEAWPGFDGLTYACSDAMWLIRDGQLQRVPVAQPWGVQGNLALSPDGRYLALSSDVRPDGLQANVRLFDLATGELRPLGEPSSWLLVYGWTAAGQLLTLHVTPPFTDDPQGIRFVLNDPGGAAPLELIFLDLAVEFSPVVAWSPDRRTLGITVVSPDAFGSRMRTAALLDLADSFKHQPLAGASYAPLFTPDGGRVVYARSVTRVGQDGLVLQPLGGGEAVPLVTARDLARTFTSGDLPLGLRFTPLEWTRDGQTLAFRVEGARSLAGLYTVGADGSGLRRLALADAAGPLEWLGFSPDGRYLAVLETAAGDERPRPQVRLLDEQTGAELRFPGEARAAAWSPGGQWLAVAGREGLSLLSPANGERRWLALNSCQAVNWFDLTTVSGLAQ